MITRNTKLVEAFAKVKAAGHGEKQFVQQALTIGVQSRFAQRAYKIFEVQYGQL